MILFSHPTGNANVRAALNGFQQAGVLHEFYTSIASFPGSLLQKLSGLKGFNEIERRSFDPALQSLTKSYPWFEIARLLALKAKLGELVKHEKGLFCIDKVYAKHDAFVSRNLRKEKGSITGVYAYEDGCVNTFRQARSMGISCWYDLPIGYWRASKKILELESEKWPEWVNTLGGLKDSAEKLLRKDEELQLADLILVASSFTAKTLHDFPGKLSPVKVIPYGFPPVNFSRTYTSLKKRKLKLLFVGGLSQRKGIANLFEAVDSFGDQLSLTVVGNKPKIECKPLNKYLLKHNWIQSLPHNKILQLMREHDLFIFPSLFEGFGLVITEAMSQGTPVITTERTCGADLIENGKNGWLVDAGSTSQLKEAIENLIANPDLLVATGMAAMETAALRPWTTYGCELAGTTLIKSN